MRNNTVLETKLQVLAELSAVRIDSSMTSIRVILYSYISLDDILISSAVFFFIFIITAFSLP